MKPEAMELSAYLTVGDASDYLGISRATMWRRIRDGELPAYQAGLSRRVKLVKRRDLDKLRQPRKLKGK